MKSRQEAYANRRRRSLEFEIGDHVYLRVSPMKGVKRFGMKGKLAPCYFGPFPILEKCGTVVVPVELLLLPNLGSRFLLVGRVVTPLVYCSSNSVVRVSHDLL
jgi:hypothetical protein